MSQQKHWRDMDFEERGIAIAANRERQAEIVAEEKRRDNAPGAVVITFGGRTIQGMGVFRSGKLISITYEGKTMTPAASGAFAVTRLGSGTRIWSWDEDPATKNQ